MGIKRVLSLVLAMGLVVDGYSRICAACMWRTGAKIKNTFTLYTNSMHIDKSDINVHKIEHLTIEDKKILEPLISQIEMTEKNLFLNEFTSNLKSELNVSLEGVNKNKAHTIISTEINDDKKLAFNPTKSSFLDATNQPTIEIKPTSNFLLKSPQFLTKSYVKNNNIDEYNSNYEFKSQNPSDFDKIFIESNAIENAAYSSFFKTPQITQSVEKNENNVVEYKNLNNTEESAAQSLLKSNFTMNKKNLFQQGVELTNNLETQVQNPLNAVSDLVRVAVEKKINKPVICVLKFQMDNDGNLQDIDYIA